MIESVLFPQTERDGQVYLQVMRSDELVEGRGRNVFFDDELQVAVFRSEGALFAVSNICPHQHAAVIAKGFVEEGTVTCPLHGWIYSLRNGKALGGGAKLRTFTVVEDDGWILLAKPEPERPKWLDNF